MNDRPLSAHPLPEHLGPYRVRGILGAGGMGVVYAAEEPSTGQMVAVKTVSGVGPDRLQSLRAEVVALTRIHHPGLVRILDHTVDAGVPWFAMELLPGQNLADYNDALWKRSGIAGGQTTEDTTMIGAVRPLADASQPGDGAPMVPPIPLNVARPVMGAGRGREVLTIFRRLCLALANLHGKGFVHRDVKPSNVMVKPDGQPVLLDFGLAARTLGTLGRESLEIVGRLVGTPAYVAPEQIRREFVDARADLYSIGCMLYETLTGVRPFIGSSIQELCRQHLELSPIPPSELVAGLPAGLESLILRLLAKTKRERIGHADDVAGALLALGAEDDRAETELGASYLYRPELSGREGLLAEAAAALDAAARGSGGCLLLGAESGAGKTFVASEVARLATLRGMRVVAGECAPSGLSTLSGLDVHGSPLHPLRTLFQAIADACRQGGQGITDHLLGPRGKVLQPYAPAFESLPGQARYPAPPELNGEENLRRLLEDLRTTLTAFARSGVTLVWILDDLQWADEVSLKLLGALVSGELRELPLFIVATYRSDERGPRLDVLLNVPGVVRRDVERLGETHVGQLISDMLGIPAAPEPFVRFVARHSEGNPFFVGEYLRAAVADGFVRRAGSTWTFTDSTDEESLTRIAVPRSVHDLVNRRVASLSAETRTLLEHAAVLGRVLDPSLLISVVGMDEATAVPLLRDLVARQILETTQSGQYRFAHDKLREITYGAIEVGRARALHHKAAAALEPVLSAAGRTPDHATLAHHFMQAEQWEKAAAHVEKAGDQALVNFSNREALSYFRSALALRDRLPSGPDPLRLARWERGLVEAHLGLGEYEAGREHAEASLRHCRMPFPKSTLGWVAGLLLQAGRHAVQSLVPWSFQVRSPERARLLSEGSYVLNRLFEPMLFANLPLQAATCGLWNLNLAQRLAPSIPFARGYASMSIVAGMAAPLAGVARAWGDRSIELARTLGDEETLTYTLGRSSCFLISVAEWDEAQRRLDEARRISGQIGDRRGFEEVVSIDGLRLFFSGRFVESQRCGAELVESARIRGDRQTELWGQNIQLQALGRMGRIEEALKLVDRLSELVDAGTTDLDRAYVLGNFAFVFAQAGNLDRARHYAELSLKALGQRRPAAYFLLAGMTSVAEAYLILVTSPEVGTGKDHRALSGGFAQARRAVKQIAQLMRFGRPSALLYRGIGLSLKGRPAAARRALLRSLDWAQRLRVPYEEARVRLELSSLSSAAGDGADHLSEARRLFGEMQVSYGTSRAHPARPTPH